MLRTIIQQELTCMNGSQLHWLDNICYVAVTAENFPNTTVQK